MKWIIDTEKCNGCGQCEDFCPESVYKVNEKTKKAEPIRKDHCIHCFICVDSCPKNAIFIEVE
ncbi:MAG: 4Fe-4S dicluster domain-containing protein [Candidatus Helarchaeota archaeon]